MNDIPEAKSTLAEQAYSAIIDFILDGTLAPGAIANEVELARRLSMSRGPVREALRRLEGRKLVTREAFQRARIVTLGPSEAREIFEFREGLETVACRLATGLISPEALDDFANRLEKAAQGEGTAFDLHLEIARHCGNTRIMEFLTHDLYDLLRIFRKRSGTSDGRGRRAFEEHWQIVRAMKARDAELAESLMRSHIRRATEHLVRVL